ncbi:MAG: two-component system regulatory protein YycI [Apilactobacillus sp.]|uniref:two-component system regulatory protein YycI n=1 Tax=Apilactobacillus TaxID=2767877 RepID=UPI0025F1DE7A|nr:two-component system regulatory protein YycI [Apilactobacillus sp.]MCT6823262.1 two-component system regulatory protein YycI [Apilactobacillus sp.]MCT6858576.1 two-component system regulatory protein YycI [Apilactobacillus sp.]
MDFKKIQIIFLVIFVVIDLFLFSLFRQNANLQTENSNKGSDAEIIKQMQNDQITVSPKLSTSGETGYYLSAVNDDSLNTTKSKLKNQKTTYSNHILRSTFKRPIGLYSGNYHEILDKLMKKDTFIAHGSSYEYNSDLSTKTSVVYSQKISDGGTMYGPRHGEIIFDVSSDHLLVGYTQSYMNDVSVLREKTDIISPAKALVWLYQYNEIPDNSKIKWVNMYYTQLLSIKNNVVLIPTWVIGYTSSGSSSMTIKRINAFNGAILDGEGTTEAATSNDN